MQHQAVDNGCLLWLTILLRLSLKICYDNNNIKNTNKKNNSNNNNNNNNANANNIIITVKV